MSTPSNSRDTEQVTNRHPSPEDGGIRAQIRSVLHTSVVAANNALAQMEHKTRAMQESPFVTSVRSLEEKTMGAVSNGLAKGQWLYTHRRDYGLQIVSSTGLAAGGLAALRRGRLAGAIAGGLGASMAYVLVYEQQVDLESAFDILFGKEDK